MQQKPGLDETLSYVLEQKYWRSKKIEVSSRCGINEI